MTVTTYLWWYWGWFMALGLPTLCITIIIIIINNVSVIIIWDVLRTITLIVITITILSCFLLLSWFFKWKTIQNSPHSPWPQAVRFVARPLRMAAAWPRRTLPNLEALSLGGNRKGGKKESLSYGDVMIETRWETHGIREPMPESLKVPWYFLKGVWLLSLSWSLRNWGFNSETWGFGLGISAAKLGFSIKIHQT